MMRIPKPKQQQARSKPAKGIKLQGSQVKAENELGANHILLVVWRLALRY